jgi:FAD/FMN-containing dehydrogenase
LFADYFSQQQQQVIPACVVLPTSPEDVSAAVKIIGQKECIFAVKSGGHATFPGASNCPGCINLDLRYLNSLDVSEDLSTAFVGTSNRWGDVYNYLEHMNITVIGGRGTQVGVGGFLLGGEKDLHFQPVSNAN